MPKRAGIRGFTLLELTMVLAISGLMVGYVMTLNASAPAMNPIECNATTRAQLLTIRGAIEAFARKNDRLPLPAARNVGVESVTYGRESSGANIDAAGGVSFGALPFQTLGLPVTYAGDCLGNKYTYAVTTALTTNASSGGFLDSTVNGNITLKDGSGNTINTITAYAVISHGDDGLGAVKLNYTAANAGGGPPDTAHGWCSGAATLKYTNCLATAATLADAQFNNGPTAGASYFDDIIVAAGKPQMLTTASSSNLYCWGDNTYGEIGDGTNAQRTTPKAVTLPAGVTGFNQVVAGSWHACGIGNNGKTYCWGYNSAGQLGDGTNTNSNVPKEVPGGYIFTTIAAGANHNCALTESGDAYCWGDNPGGAVGDGTNFNTRTSPTPVTMPMGVKFTSIYADGDNTCAISGSNDAYCWGLNGSQQIGNGTWTYGESTPTLVSGGLKFSKLSIAGFTCGITVSGDTYCWGAGPEGSYNVPTALSTNGVLYFKDVDMGSGYGCLVTSAGAGYCMGYGGDASLGYGWVTDMTSPTAVAGGIVFKTISASYRTSCGVTANGKAYCWGKGDWGNIGDGGTSGVFTPTQVSGSGAGSLYFSSIAAGAGFTCGIAPTSKAYGWDGSSNFYGTIGDGTSGAVRADPTVVADSHVFTLINRQNNFTCGITSNGDSYCWGFGLGGKLGTALPFNAFTANPNPLLVAGGYHFTKLITGDNHSCAINEDGNAYCWGNGGFGQMGDGLNNTYSTPNYVSGGGYKFTTMSAGNEQSCGIRDNGSAYCWGRNSNQSLGVGSMGLSEYSPLPVTGGHKFTAITTGYRFSCGIKDNGDGYCWGKNSAGSLGVGVGDTANRASPTVVFGGHKFKQISAGYQHVCALDDGGYPYCWGYNWSGQIGNGTSGAGTDVTTPYAVLVGGVATTFKSIQAGTSTSCAYKADGRAYCWGNSGGGVVSTPTLVTGSGAAPLFFDGNASGSLCAIVQ